MRISTFDRAGVGISALCIAHCLLLPMVPSVLPLVGLLSENEMVHKMLVMLAMIPMAFAYYGGVTQKFAPVIYGLGILGISSLFVGAFVERLHDFETVLTTFGAICLASAHIFRLLFNKLHIHEN